MRHVAGCLAALALAVLFTTSGVDAMAPEGKQELPLAKTETQKSERVTIKDIVEDPSSFAGKEVVLQGTFRGWGQCKDSTSLTRSDWVLEDESGCIYATGQIPPGVSPTKPKGERMTVIGTIMKSSNGKAVLSVSSIKLIPLKPGKLPK